MPAIVLECPCGKKVRAPGATPGRVGRCPACGGELRVPADLGRPAEEPAEPRPARKAARREPERTGTAFGLAGAPEEVERNLFWSFAYPLWDFPGLMVPVLIAPVMVVATMVAAFILGLFMTGLWPLGMPLLPFLLFCVAAYAYAGQVMLAFLLASARGEVLHPRWPEPSLGALGKTLGRWGVAGGIGLAIAGLPMLVWPGPGSDLLGWEGVRSLALIAAGLAGGAWALVAMVMHDSVRGASPGVLIGSFAKVFLAAVGPAATTGLLVAAGLVALAVAARRADGLAALASLWGLWMYALYAALVGLRMWGLCYYRNRHRIGWFPERERWGVRA